MKILQAINRYFFYQAAQYWNKKKIEQFQDKMLIKLVRHAAENVPYYRSLFEKSGFDVYKFKGTIDMYRIPLLDKDTVRNKYNEFVADNAKTFGINYDSTSGSTGTPLKLIIDDNAEANKMACLVRSYSWAGYRIYKKSFGLQSYLKNDFPKHAGLNYSKLRNVYRFDSNQLNKESAIKIANELNQVKPKFYFGYPLPMLMLGKIASDNQIPMHSPEAIVVYGETLSRKRRAILEDYYRTNIYDFYSLHECSSIISDCSFGNKHWMDDFAYNEVIDETGTLIENGTGELVGTNFYNYAMPLIRYRIRDYVTVSNKNELCKCGRNFRIIKEIIGRQNDFIETPDGRFLGNVMEHSIDDAVGVTLSQCVQDRIDHIYVNLVVDETFNFDFSVEKIEKAMRKRLGNKINIDFQTVQELEKTNGGKTPFILSKIGHDYL